MDQKNLILAIAISVSILLGWQLLFEAPRVERERAVREAQQQAQQTEQTTTRPPAAPQVPATAVPSTPGVPAAPGAPAAPAASPGAPVAGQAAIQAKTTRAAALAAIPRVRIDTPRLHGSIALTGGRIDDLTLLQYRETVDPNSPEVELFSPEGAPNPYFAEFGWVASGAGVKMPGHDTVWRADRPVLTAQNPVTFTWDNGAGLAFTRTVAVDENYMFTITERVRNAGAEPVTLHPYALVSRTGTPKTLGFFILHEGLLGVLGGTLVEIDYDDLAESGKAAQESTGGWLGISDKYWLGAVIPDQKEKVAARFAHYLRDKIDVYQADFLGGARVLAPGTEIEATSRLFAGAKEVRLLDAYEERLGIARFDLGVDFGWFYFLTKPIFYVLEYFYGLLGNFGLAILLLTVLIKLAFFPLANKSYRAMSRLKVLQPQMMEIRERCKDDRAKMNQEMMALYKASNANPMSGCLPILIQIPVFFALYKVLFVTIEMRHAPFYGWIRDLSVPDPTTIFNLFGLIPWTPPDFLLIGGWPVIMGVTMFLQQKLNPAPPDPMQQKMFMLLPFIFTFILAPFPAGLVIYWAWNNLLSIAQQWVIMRQTRAAAQPGKPAKT
ncbi:MAG TPA: membrane protein insertase YidC [Alphaproteobacteria bacterium]